MTIETVLDTLYLTFSHNQYAIAFFAGAILSLFSLLIKPSRSKVLLLIGFSLLLLGFEYNKHIMDPLMSQTLESLKVDGNPGRASALLTRGFQKILPFGFFLFGWGSIFITIFFPKLFDKNKVAD